MRPHFRSLQLACGLLVAAVPAAGQQADAPPAAPAADSVRIARDPAPASPRAGYVRGLARIGGSADERLRVLQFTGAAPTGGYLLRAVSTLTPRRDGASYAAVLAPSAELLWNSAIPYGMNEGALRGGRGAGVSVVTGVEIALGPLRLIAAPELVYEQNREFDANLPVTWDSAQRATWIPPWQAGVHSVDLPYRYGAGSRQTVLAGESSLTLRAGPVELGAGTESQWWGPGIRNAILLSNQAGGFPHAFVRTARPLAGGVEATWIAGQLDASPYDTVSAGGRRSLSGAALVLSPAFARGLSLGVGRVVYAGAEDNGVAAGAADVFTRWRGEGDTTGTRPFEQILSFFGRWVLPGDHAEVYAEWARHQLPSSLRDVLTQPEHTQGYTLGLQWAHPAGNGLVRLQTEVTDLEKSATYRARPIGSYYASRAVPQGYTYRGKIVGAAIGPGASSQWLAVDWMRPASQLGIFATRVRWENDAFYDKTDFSGRYRGHDVSLLYGLRGGVALGGAWIDAEWTAGKRYNFLFQGVQTNWGQDDMTRSPYNHSLRLRLSVAPPRVGQAP